MLGLSWVVMAFVLLTLYNPLHAVTAYATSADRTLYFKLPLEGVEFHWEFLDSQAFLSGELTLRIINKDRDDTIVVFRDGKISDGWETIGEDDRSNRAYFGFATQKRFRTRADDSLIVTLTVKKDLAGQGPDSEGTLAAGVWQMSGTYSSIYGGRWNPMDLAVLHGNPPVAFMECWAGVWPLKITKHEGWMGAESGNRSGRIRNIIGERGTNGRACKSHI